MTGEKLLQKWQKRLGLTEWHIVLKENCTPNDMCNDVCGECEIDEVHKIAVVRIIDRSYYGDRIVPYNFEKTLIHELLHIKFVFIDNSGNELRDRILHQNIEDLAKGFLLADKEYGDNDLGAIVLEDEKKCKTKKPTI